MMCIAIRTYAEQDNFIPLILETGGRVNKAARDWLDALTALEPGEQVPSQDDRPWNPQTRTTTETVLREAMQALVRVQAHMLARIVAPRRRAQGGVQALVRIQASMLADIVVAIPAVDLAVEARQWWY
jgi:hypothetical protein